MTEPIRVLIADDHAVVRSGLRLFLDLQSDIEVVGEAVDGADALEQASELRPDVAVMDIVMPGVDGIRATQDLKERLPDVRVLVVSSYTDEERVLPALRAGAVGYLTKDTAPEELAEAIRTVHRGEPVLCADATERVLRQFSRPQQRPEGTVTVLFTDIEGSTALLESLGETRAREVFHEHDRIVRDVVAAHGGVEVEHVGDAFMVAFSSARRAVLCAAEIQRALEAGPVRVRIGANTGEVIAEQDQYFGRAVFLASRVAGQAAGGEILVSELTHRLAGSDEIACREKGEFELKGLRGAHRLFEVDWRS